MKNISKERWRQIEALLDRVLDLEPEERTIYLDEACGDDAVLRREVESLLEADKGTPGFLEEEALAFAHPFLPDLTEESSVEDSAAGERVGSYRLLEVAGRGGMATVYRAERAEGDFEQEVAIKLLPPGKGTEAVLRRFEHEEQVLATLNHPSIARLYDGGLTEEGRPYFVMEYVAGQPIDQYCDAHRLSIKARLQLFRKVAEAVHYAHRNLVVHRDLKPSNILVTEDGTVKLLDFGIAKLLAGNEGEAILLTQTGERWMTPGYAAPEQVRAEPITTATDVYQLGVVLYELLAGRRPYRVVGRSTFEIERAICEDEPARPSTVVTQPVKGAHGESPTELTPEAVSEARSTGIEQLRKDLSGDLDAIILKALRKEPDERYASAEAFVKDIKRYLASQPVEARRGSRGYRARKFARRHWQGVSTAALIALLLVGYAVTTTVQNALIRAEADKLEHVSTFLVDLFELSNPGGVPDSAVSARSLLDRSAREIESGLAAEPEIQAEIQTTLGRIYSNLGLYDESAGLLEAALTTQRELYNSAHPALATTLQHLAVTLADRQDEGDLPRALRYFDEALSMWQRLPNVELATAQTMIDKGVLLQYDADLDQAEIYYENALSLLRRSGFGDHSEAAIALNNLGELERRRGHYADAESLLTQAIAIEERLYGRNHWLTAVSLSTLAEIMTTLERDEIADSLHREVIAIQEMVLGPDHLRIANALAQLGRSLHGRGLLDEAEPLYHRAHAIRLSSLGEGDGLVGTSLGNLASLSHDRGDYAAAESLYLKKLEIDVNAYGHEDFYVAADLAILADVAHDMGALERSGSLYRRAIAIMPTDEPQILAQTLGGYARLLTQQARATEAKPFAVEALAILESTLPPGNKRIAEAQSVLGNCLSRLGHFDEAEPLLIEAKDVLQERRGLRHRHTREALEGLVLLYEAWGKPREATRYSRLLRGAG